MNKAPKRPQLLACRLIEEAQVYVESARRLDKACRNSARFFGPTYFLLCHSIELALKAYLEHFPLMLIHNLRVARN